MSKSVLKTNILISSFNIIFLQLDISNIFNQLISLILFVIYFCLFVFRYTYSRKYLTISINIYLLIDIFQHRYDLRF